METVVYRIMRMPANSADQVRAKWVAKLMPGAEPTARSIGISPEALIAQAALETGWGKAAIGNNIFGVKADASWSGRTQDVATWEDVNGAAPGGEVNLIARFRDYDSIADSFSDHFRFLSENSRYRNAGVFSRQGDEAYFAALQRAGYATDPAYAAKLGSILRTIKGYTAAMERIEVAAPAGYEVTPTGNVVNPNPASSTIVRDARQGSTLGKIAATAGTVAPAAAAVSGMDWKLAAVFGVILVVLGLLWIWKGHKIVETRLDMSRQGVV